MVIIAAVAAWISGALLGWAAHARRHRDTTIRLAVLEAENRDLRTIVIAPECRVRVRHM